MERTADMDRGLTLIELMIAIAIIAILAALAAPSFTQYIASQRLKGVTEEILTDLQYARSESVQRNAPVTVTFSTTGYMITTAPSLNLKTVVFNSGSALASGNGLVLTYEPIRATAASSLSPAQFEIGNSGISGVLRVTLNALGRASVCSSNSGITGYQSCS